MNMVYDQIEGVFEEGTEEWEQFDQAIEVWVTSSKREIMEHFTTEEVMEATAQIVEHTPEIELKLKADHISVKALLADFGDQIHIAKVNDKYVLMIEANSLTFEKGCSPIEFLKPDELEKVVERIAKKL